MPNCLHIIDHIEAGGAQKIITAFLDNDAVFVLRTGKLNSIAVTENLVVYPSKRRYSLRPLKTIISFIKENKIDTIIAHLPRSQAFASRIKAKIPTLKYIHYEHGDVFEDKLLSKYIIRKSIKSADAIIAVSSETKKRILQNNKKAISKVHLLTNFVDDVFFGNPKKEKKDNRIHFGFSARIIQRKGWKTLLEAVSKLHKNDFFLHIAGTGKDTNEMLSKIKSLQLEKNTKYYGFVNNMPDFYTKLDALIIPSYWEPFGLIALEAMATKTFVIASDVDGMNEILKDGENAMLFDPKNSEDLVSKMQSFIDNKYNTAAIIHQASNDVQNYSKQSFIEKYMHIIDSIRNN